MNTKTAVPNKMALLTAVLLIAVYAVTANAASLWDNSSSLFADQKASRVGDIVTVKVVEQVDTSDEGKTKTSKNADGTFGDGESKGGRGLLGFIRALGFENTANYQGNSKAERTLKTGTTLSCLVIEVLPNGNLVIQGDRQVVTHAERLIVRFSGVVRPVDVSSENMVASNRVANAELVITGKGTITRTQRPGVITQVLQAIF